MSEHVPMEQTRVFGCFVELADDIWEAVDAWSPLAKSTVGKQIIRSADSVGANLVEGDGRYGDGEALSFFAYARGSARETRYWTARALKRKLIPQHQAEDWTTRLDRGLQMLNALMSYRRQTKNKHLVKEELALYNEAVSQSPQTPSAQRPTPSPIPPP